MGSKHLHEYLDIRKIIKRLQDLDKLKMVLLTEDQRRLFEHIPKPYVIDPTNKFSMESITKYKKKANTRKATIVINNLDDPIDQRILECLNPNIKIKNGVTNGNFFSNIYFLKFF